MGPVEMNSDVDSTEWADGEELVLTTGKEGEWMKLENPSFYLDNEEFVSDVSDWR